MADDLNKDVQKRLQEIEDLQNKILIEREEEKKEIEKKMKRLDSITEKQENALLVAESKEFPPHLIGTECNVWTVLETKEDKATKELIEEKLLITSFRMKENKLISDHRQTIASQVVELSFHNGTKKTITYDEFKGGSSIIIYEKVKIKKTIATPVVQSMLEIKRHGIKAPIISYVIDWEGKEYEIQSVFTQ